MNIRGFQHQHTTAGGNGRVIEITSRHNPTFEDTERIISIYARKDTISYRATANQTPHGFLNNIIGTFIVPNLRKEVNDFVLDICNTKFIARITNCKGESLVLNPCILDNLEQVRGGKKSSDNHYVFNFKSAQAFRVLPSLTQTADVRGSVYNETSGNTPTIDTTTTTPIEDTPNGNAIDYFVKVNQIELSYVPSGSNNNSNLNEIVKGADGNTYFIDINGNSAMLNGGSKFYQEYTSGDTFAIPDSLDHKQLLVLRNNMVLKYNDNTYEGYSLTANTVTITEPLLDGERITIYQI